MRTSLTAWSPLERMCRSPLQVLASAAGFLCAVISSVPEAWMNTPLLTAWIVCVVAAIVGGGVKLLGANIPALTSTRRQVALGSLGVMFLVASAVARDPSSTGGHHAAARPRVYDLEADFSDARNPNGPWTYGFFKGSPEHGTLHLYQRGTDPEEGLAAWNPELAPWPFVIGNTTDRRINHGEPLWRPHQVVLHPGTSGWYSNVRWTVPESGTYKVTAEFTGNNPRPTSSDVYILRDGEFLMHSDLIGFGTARSYSEFLLLNRDEMLDFAVGPGPRQDFGGDDTAVEIQISRQN
jgi:hypothetical protein